MKEFSPCPNDIERYRIVRSYVEHEDRLINFRLSWFLAVQGLLLGGLGLTGSHVIDSNIAASAIASDQQNLLRLPHELIVVFVVISFFALGVCYRAFRTVRSAMSVITRLHKDYSPNFMAKGFPPLAGGPDGEHEKVRNVHLPIYFAVFWIVILGLLYYSWSYF